MNPPLDTWRVCGRPVDPARSLSGCTCNENDPSPWLVTKALTRLTEEDRDREEVSTVPAPRQTRRAARKASP